MCHDPLLLLGQRGEQPRQRVVQPDAIQVSVDAAVEEGVRVVVLDDGVGTGIVLLDGPRPDLSAMAACGP